MRYHPSRSCQLSHRRCTKIPELVPNEVIYRKGKLLFQKEQTLFLYTLLHCPVYCSDRGRFHVKTANSLSCNLFAFLTDLMGRAAAFC